jgi:hypothetical protein
MTNGGAAAAAAAAAARRRREQEEETMTGYSAQELAEGWEFKIVRSATSGFKRPDFLKQVLEEERRAGWTLLEKFDNGRIRLKRPASARAGDQALGFDPYRSRVGMSEPALGLLIGGCVLAVVAIAIAIIATAVRH